MWLVNLVRLEEAKKWDVQVPVGRVDMAITGLDCCLDRVDGDLGRGLVDTQTKVRNLGISLLTSYCLGRSRGSGSPPDTFKPPHISHLKGH